MRPALLSVLGGRCHTGALPRLLLLLLLDVDDDFDVLDDDLLLLDFDEPSEDLDPFSLGSFFLFPEVVARVLTAFLLASDPGAGVAKSSSRLLM